MPANLGPSGAVVAALGLFFQRKHDMLDIKSLMPDDLKNCEPPFKRDMMTSAWIGCVLWCLEQEEAVAEFREATGNQWQPGKTSLDRMIDEACGMEEKFLREFILWVNENVWGALDGPGED